jgi:hypothetical protein
MLQVLALFAQILDLRLLLIHLFLGITKCVLFLSLFFLDHGRMPLDFV